MCHAIRFLLFITNLEDSKSAALDLFNKISSFVLLFPCMFPVSSVYFLYATYCKRVTVKRCVKRCVKQLVLNHVK
jgi:hypothetical protein